MKPRERIYIIPTWPGFVFALVVFLVFAAGYFLGGFGGAPQVLVISLLVAGILTMIETNDNLRGVAVTSCHSRPVPAGEDVVLQVALTNFADRERLGLKIRFRDGWKLRVVGSLEVLRVAETITVPVRLPTTRRGAFAVQPLWVTSSLPAGICFAWKSFSDTGTYHVYPRGKSWRIDPPGEGWLEGRGKAGIEEVSGHRPYQPGDALNRMDWRVFGRTGGLVVRTFEGVGGGGRRTFAWVDTAFLESTEDRLEQLSFWVSECVRANRPFALDLGGAIFTERNLTSCHTALARFRVMP
jgi:uncharacterized protein (DUF58 family)